MRGLERNKIEIHYKNLVSSEPILDEYGNETSEYRNIYSDAKSCRLRVAPNTGEGKLEVFGNFTDYDRAMITFDKDIDISNTSILWIERSIAEVHNFEVKKIAKDLNSVVYAVKEVHRG